MVILSQEQISAIAAEVVKQLRPMLIPTAVPGQEPAEVEIGRVMASGMDLVEYLKERAKRGRKK